MKPEHLNIVPTPGQGIPQAGKIAQAYFTGFLCTEGAGQKGG
jgi:hypothetical protein